MKQPFSTGIFHTLWEISDALHFMQSNSPILGKNSRLKCLFHAEKCFFLWKSMWEVWITFNWDRLWKTKKMAKLMLAVNC